MLTEQLSAHVQGFFSGASSPPHTMTRYRDPKLATVGSIEQKSIPYHFANFAINRDVNICLAIIK